MPPKNIVPPQDEFAATHTDLTLEREKIELERERLALERERLAAERDRWKIEAELTPATKGRLSITPATIVIAAVICCVTGTLIGLLVQRLLPATIPPPVTAKLELRSLTSTNAQGEVRSVFYVQTGEKESGISRILLD